MNLKKVLLNIGIMLIILLGIPFLLINIAEPTSIMGICIFLFFVFNPICIAFISFICGKDIKKCWWIPLLFCILFLLSYWIVLEQVIYDLFIYSLIYLVVGLVFMIISYFIFNKIKK